MCLHERYNINWEVLSFTNDVVLVWYIWNWIHFLLRFDFCSDSTNASLTSLDRRELRYEVPFICSRKSSLAGPMFCLTLVTQFQRHITTHDHEHMTTHSLTYKRICRPIQPYLTGVVPQSMQFVCL